MDAPVELGDRRELFVDDTLIERMDGTRLELGQPVSAGPAMRFDRPWEGAFSGYGTLLKDGKRVRLYYRGWRRPDPDLAVTCLAESEDGINFERPNLGLCEIDGSRDNNVFLTIREGMFDMTAEEHAYPHNFAPLLDTRPGVADDQRYKALASGKLLNGFGDEAGLFAFVSADGIHWRKLAEGPVLTKGTFDSQNVAFWSEAEGCYVCYFRIAGRIGEDISHTAGFRGGVRSIARSTSEDFLHWSDPVEMDMAGTLPEHLYTNQTQPYFRAPHIYLALPGRFFPEKKVLADQEGEAMGVHKERKRGVGYWQDCSDAVLMTSRGGNRYDRTFMQAFVRPGLDRRNWTSRCNYPACGLVQTGESEMSFYIERHNAQDGKYLERMTLRLDGLASLRAGIPEGTMRTRPLSFEGSGLFLNYSTSAAGRITVGIENPDGSPIEGFSEADCRTIVGDEIERQVRWSGGADVSALAGKAVRLTFTMRDADLYSFRFGGGE